MSLALHPQPIVQMMEPRTKIYNQRQYAVLRGGSESTWKPVISTSYSDSSIQFTAPPPSPGIMIDRKVLINIPFTITMSAIASTGSGFVFTTGTAAPRSRPIPRIIQTAAVTLNNTQVSMNTSDVIDPFLHYCNIAEKREVDDSLSPSMLDQSPQYSDVNGGVRSPLLAYASSVSGADTSRGAFPFTVTSNTTGPTGTAVINATFTDYLYLPPFLSDADQASAFINLQTMDFTLTLGNLSRIWSVDNVNANCGSVTATISGNPRLFFNYITPDPLIQVPKSVVYPYYSVDRYPTSNGLALTAYGTAASTNSVTQSSANIQLNSIPTKMYIFARQRNQDRTAFTSDIFAGITNVSINFDNRSGLLSSATQFDLFKMSQENGMNLSWLQFSRWVGSPVCVVFGKILPKW